MILHRSTATGILAWGLALALSAAVAAPALAQDRVRRVYGAIDRITETYRQIELAREQGLEPPPELIRSRALAIDAIAQAGPLASGPLREALQQEDLPTSVAFVLGTLLALTDGPTAGDFLLGRLKERDPREDPVEAFRFAHTLMTLAPHHGAVFAEKLAELPTSVRFPVPAEEISFPLVGGIAWLYAAGDTPALNDLAALIEDVSRLPPHVAEILLRVSARLQLIQLLPAVQQQVEQTDPESPRMRALIWTLGQFDDPRVIDQLDRLRRTLEDPKLRQEATFALSEIQSPAALGPLKAALTDSDPGVRSYAIAGLARLALPGAREALRNAIGGKESDPKVQSDYLRAAREVGDRTWRDGLKQAAKNWPRHELMCKETSLKLARRDPPKAGMPPLMWPDLPMNRLEPARLNEQLWDVINAKGSGFSQLKKTVLYSATPQHVQHLEYLRTLLAKEISRRNLNTWLDVLDTLQLVRRRLRTDPRPLFASPGKPAP